MFVTFSSQNDGYDGKIYAIFLKDLDTIRLFHWRATISDFEIKDGSGVAVEKWKLTLPYMGESDEKVQEKQKRKVYVGGVGNTNNYQLARTICDQSECIKQHCVELWVVMNYDRVSKGYAFMTMDSEDAARHVIGTIGLINPEGSMMRLDEPLPVVAPVMNGGSLNRDNGKRSFSRSSAFASGGGGGMMDENTLEKVTMNAVGKLFQTRHRHVANPEVFEQHVGHAIQGQRGFYMGVSDEPNDREKSGLLFK